MTELGPKQSYLDPYRQAVRQFGPGFDATLWSSPKTQIIRFDVMIDVVDFEQCTVLDAGCGQGDFAARLIERDVAFKHYIGLDAVEEMLRHAQGRDLPRCEFEVADFVTDESIFTFHPADFVCISGALNTIDEPTAREVVSRAFEASAQGVVFNFLSDRYHPRWASQQLGPAKRYNTAAWVDWAMNLSSRVTFTQDYLDGHDATIVIRHE